MSIHTLFENHWMKRLSIVVVVLLAGSVVSLLAVTMRSFNDVGVFGSEEQAAVASRNLTDYSADEVLAYRWQAMAQYYADHPEISVPIPR